MDSHAPKIWLIRVDLEVSSFFYVDVRVLRAGLLAQFMEFNFFHWDEVEQYGCYSV